MPADVENCLSEFAHGIIAVHGTEKRADSVARWGHRSRKDYLTRAVEHERQGNQTAAYECYQKAVDITPAIALRLIQVQSGRREFGSNASVSCFTIPSS